MHNKVARTMALTLAAVIICCLSSSGIQYYSEPPIAYMPPQEPVSAEPSADVSDLQPHYAQAERSSNEVVLPDNETIPLEGGSIISLPSPAELPGVSPSPEPSPSPSGELKKAYLTFDDGPCIEGDSPEQNTAAILDILAKYDIKATFFVMGAHAKQFPDLLLREYNEGHLIGNHTYSHVDAETVSDEKFLGQVASTNNVIKRITGYKPEFFRVPYASELSSGQRKGLHMHRIGWDLDTRDWAGESVEDILAKVRKAAEKGKKSIRILFHDRHAQGLEQVIQLLMDYGYTFDTIDHWYQEKTN